MNDLSNTGVGAGLRDGASGLQQVAGFSPLASGIRLGHLRIQAVLGAGQLGITYAAEHGESNKRYALKEYFPRALAQRDGYAVRPRAGATDVFNLGLAGFLEQARAVQKLQHPAIVTVHGVTEAGGTGYVGMAYEMGRDFGIWLHELRRSPTQEELDAILGPLLDGLEAAHDAGLIHGDICADAVIIRENGSPVLVDFGAHRVILRGQSLQGGPREPARPEPAADIQGLSGLLYRAVTGDDAWLAGGVSGPSASSGAKGKYRRRFLAAIDAGLARDGGLGPRSIAEWRYDLTGIRSKKPPQSHLVANREEPLSSVEPAAAPVARGNGNDRPVAGRGKANAQRAQGDKASRARSVAETPAIQAASSAPEPAALKSASIPPPNAETIKDPIRPPDESAAGNATAAGIAGAALGFVGAAAAAGPLARLVVPGCGDGACLSWLLPVSVAIAAAAGFWLGTSFAASRRS